MEEVEKDYAYLNAAMKYKTEEDKYSVFLFIIG